MCATCENANGAEEDSDLAIHGAIEGRDEVAVRIEKVDEIDLAVRVTTTRTTLADFEGTQTTKLFDSVRRVFRTLVTAATRMMG